MTKKQKIAEKDKVFCNKEKKNDLPKKDKPTAVTTETIKDQSAGNKGGKPTTVMHMLKAKRDANILKSSSHINKGSKSTSSATSDDSSSSESDSSDSSSDADPSKHSQDDDFDNLKNNGLENIAITSVAQSISVSNKIQLNGTTASNNIPQEVDKTFFENLTTIHRDSINRLIDYSKNQNDNTFQDETLDLLYEYVIS